MKIFNTIQQTTSAKLVLSVLMATFVFAAAANAQPVFKGKFVLPQEVRWNDAVLPAGEYSIRMDSIAKSAVLRSTSTHQSFYTAVPAIADAEKGTAHLNVTNRGNVRSVRSLYSPEIGKTLIFERLTKTESEMFAKSGQVEAVPVITARK